MKTIFNIVCLSLICFSSISQSIYIGDIDGLVYEVNLSTCETILITDTAPFSDIAFDTEGQLLGIANSSIQNIDTITGNPSPIVHTYEGNGMIGLTISNNNIHYGATTQGEIYSYNPLTDVENFFYQTENWLNGDISFVNNYLIAAGTNDRITFVNRNDTTDISEINFGNLEGGINGLSSTWHDCKLKTYASVTNAGKSRIYELDFQELDTILICSFDFVVYGSGFKNEHLTSLDSIELANLCESVSTQNFDEISSDINLYPNPSNSIVTIESKNAFGTLYNVNGELLIEFEIFNGSHELNLETYQPGIYILRLDKKYFKIVKQ